MFINELLKNNELTTEQAKILELLSMLSQVVLMDQEKTGPDDLSSHEDHYVHELLFVYYYGPLQLSTHPCFFG